MTNIIGTSTIQSALLANVCYPVPYQILERRMDKVAEKTIKRTVDASDVVVLRTFLKRFSRQGVLID